MNHQSTSSLYNAPITKLLLFTLFGCTIFLEYTNMKRGQSKQQQTVLNDSLNQFKYISLIKNQFLFSSVFEMIIGCFLLYSFRILERIMGSSKYFVFLLTSMSFSSLFQLAFIMLLGGSSKIAYRASPFSLIFSCLLLYIKEIPPTFWFRFLRIPMNDKVITYFLMIQSVFLFPFNLISSVSGLLSGLLITSESIQLDQILLSRIRIPRRILQICNEYFLPFLQTPIPSAQSTRQHLQHRLQQLQVQQNIQQQRGQVLIDNLFNNNQNPNHIQPQQVEGGGIHLPQAANGIVNPLQRLFQQQYQQQYQQQNQFEQYQQPNEDDIQELISMGFSRELSITALQRTGNLNDATNYLIGG